MNEDMIMHKPAAYKSCPGGLYFHKNESDPVTLTNGA